MNRSCPALLLWVALAATGCVHASRSARMLGAAGPLVPERGAPPLVRVGDPVGLRLANRAEHLLHQGGSLVRRDCSGLVETVFADVGLALPTADHVRGGGVAHEYAGFRRDGALHRDRALPGDLAFFHDTYDRNRDGRVDDPLTHVAVVTRVGLDGSVELVHFGSHGLARLRMDLSAPHVHRDRRGHTLNDWLRVRHRHDPPHTSYLSSELFVAFGRAPDAPADRTVPAAASARR